MKDQIIDFGRRAIMDGIRLGTATMIGDFITKTTKRVFSGEDQDENKNSTKETVTRNLQRGFIQGDDS